MFGKAADEDRSADSSASSARFDLRSGELASRGKTMRLEPKAAAVLACLDAAHDRLVSRQELLDQVWGEHAGSDEALTQAVAQIRRAFQELGEGDPIETLAKRGYRLTADLAAGRRSGAGVHRPGSRSVAIWTGILAAVLIFTYFQPHGLRHFVRHTLGLGFAQQNQ